MKANVSLITQIKAARRVSVPLVSIATPDPAATIATISTAVNGKGAKFAWNIVDGLLGLDDGSKSIKATILGDEDPTVGNPLALLTSAMKFPDESICFVHLAQRWIVDPSVVQALWNLRDAFKRDRRMMILLSPEFTLPPELVNDVISMDEPLPGPVQLEGIVRDLHESADLKLNKDVLDRAVEAVQGLPAFQAEQVTAMSLTKEGLDIPNLWERKRRQIEQTPGLKVHREQVGFSDIGGVDLIKSFLARVLAGQAKPSAVVFIDEIEKFIAGSGDTSGVSQDQLGTLLSYMQDHGSAGCIFVGPPGSAKSMVAKAAGNEAGIPTIQLDLGAMKGSLVGQSEQQLRSALKVVTSVSNGRSLWIATCNAISDLPPELRRRFTLGTFFFDLPDKSERKAIWKLYAKKYGRIEAECGKVMDDGWTGAEIRQCCDIGFRLDCPLTEAAQFVVPVSRSAADQLERLRKAAEGRFLSASRPGVYSRETQNTNPVTAGKRRTALED